MQAQEPTLDQMEAPVPVGMNRHIFQSVIFDLPFRYQPIKLIGKGTYGSVISAKNTQTDEEVAIKRLAPIEDIVSKICFLTQRSGGCQARAPRDHDHEELQA